MAGYRQIHTQIWKDEWFIELEPDEKLLFIYLFSNDLASISGLYKIPVRVICNETGLGKEFVCKTMAKFQQDKRIFYQDGVLWIVNMGKYHKNASPFTQQKIAADIASIPECETKRRYRQGMDTVSTLTSESLSESVNKSKSESETPDGAVPTPPPAFSPAETLEAISEFGDNSARQAHSLYCAVTGQMAIPADQTDKALPNLQLILDYYHDPEKAAPAGREVFARWCATRSTKNGKSYSRTNTGWLSWWLEQIAPAPPGASLPAEMPTPTLLCGEGSRLKRQAENKTGEAKIHAVREYRDHLQTCHLCSGGINAKDTVAAIGKLAQEKRL